MPPEDGPVFIMPNRHKMTRGDAQDIWRRLWRGWKDKVLCAQFFSHQQWYPAETWRLAISEIATGRSRPRSIAYFEQRCADIQRRLEEGAAPEAAAGSNGHFALTSAPAPPARRLSKHDAAIAKAKELRAAGHNPLARFHEPEED